MDRLIAAFERCNGSEHFEFIERITESSHGRKCKLKCKTCGSVFDTWQVNEVQKGVKTRITCPDCGMSSDGDVVFAKSPKLGELLKYYTEGHTARETAEKFGLSKMQVDNYVKNHKVSNGRTFRGGSIEHNKKQAKEAEARLEAVLESKGFVYCGGYTDRDGKVEIVCKTCGAKFTRTPAIIYHGSLVCLRCKSATHRQELKRLNEERKEQRRIELEQQRREREASKAEALFHFLNDKVHVCTVCGKSFSVSEYLQDCGLKQMQQSPKYCSYKCKRKATNKARKMSPSGKTGHYYVRARKYGVEYIPGITLKKVVARDGLRCAICGGMCDWNDHTWSSCSGPLHPSIDHIIPMAKGGPHIWENVQVAHVMCNSEKGDKVSV